MGLDMYFYAKRHLVGSEYADEKDKNKNEEVRKLFPEMFKTDNLDTIEVSFECGYWRKANAIHKWFVENCQDDEDDCRMVYVEREQLKELLNICKEVVAKTKLVNGKLIQSTSFENGEEKPNYIDG